MAAGSAPLERLLKDECSGDGFEVAWEETIPYYGARLARAGRLLRVTMIKSRDEGALMEVVPWDGGHGRLVDGLPRLDGLAVADAGWCVSSYRRRADEPTYLHFFDPHLSLVQSTSFVAAVNDMACLAWGAVAATRDGLIRAFTPKGEPMWAWEPPGAGDPRYVARIITAVAGLAVVAVMDTLFALDSDGVLRWSWRTPATRRVGYRELSQAEVRDHYAGSGGDENPLPAALDPSEAARFAGVGNPYARWVTDGEALVGGRLAANAIRSLVAGPETIAIGDSQGQVFFVEPTEGWSAGSVCLGPDDTSVRLISDTEGRVRGAIGNRLDEHTLTSLDRHEILGQARLSHHPHQGTAIGHGLVTLGGHTLQGFDPSARLRWSASPSALWLTPFDDVCVFRRESRRLVGLRSRT